MNNAEGRLTTVEEKRPGIDDLITNNRPSHLCARRSSCESISKRGIIKIEELWDFLHGFCHCGPVEGAQSSPDDKSLVGMLMQGMRWLKRECNLHDDIYPLSHLGSDGQIRVQGFCSSRVE